ncbi:MAG: hypothetical protein AAFO01_00285 [Pseudomonadota bacterium]
MLRRPSYGCCIDRRVTSAKEVVLDVIAPSRDPQSVTMEATSGCGASCSFKDVTAEQALNIALIAAGLGAG